MRKLITLAATLAAMLGMALAGASSALAQETGDGTFTVSSGDTLKSISEQLYGEQGRWEQIFEANGDRISDPDMIFPGQVLLLPSEQPSAPAAPAPEPAPEPAAEPAPTPAPEPAAPAPEPAPASPRQEAASQEAAAAPAPSDTTMSLTVPALGISGIPVTDENSEAALTNGAMHLPGTGFPWQPGSNTYIAGHRIGYPGTPSDHVFYNLPAMAQGDEVILTDANGTTYNYRVTEIFAVAPDDLSVTAPVAGRDVVTLQTCTESLTDWTTIGPSLMSSGPDSGRLIVRAERV